MTEKQFTYIPTGFDSLDNLLPNSEENKPGGIRMFPGAGFLGVIFGAASAGKSVLTLQLACSFLKKLSPRGKPKCAVFLTPEPSEVIKERVREFKFKEAFDVCEFEKLQHPGKKNRLAIFTLPSDPAEREHCVLTVFRLLNQWFMHCDRDDHGDLEKDPKERLLICVDNAESIAEDTYRRLTEQNSSAGDTPSSNVLKTVRAHCKTHRLKVWFAFEESSAFLQGNPSRDIAKEAASYAADFVIWMGINRLAGYDERVLKIVKARDQFYRRGLHPFSVRGSGNDIESGLGIVITPSISTQLFHISRETEPETEPDDRRACLGISDIDERIRRKNRLSDGRGFLASGTVSVLAADIDATSTEIALKFSVQDGFEPGLFISFQHSGAQIVEIASGALYKPQNLEIRLPAIFNFQPEHISAAALLDDIRRILETESENGANPIPVVIDGVFNLSKKYPLIADEHGFLIALFQLLRAYNTYALVVESVEVGEQHNPLEKAFTPNIADNVFLLRHVEFQGRVRKVFSVQNLATLEEPNCLWRIHHDWKRDKRGDQRVLVAEESFEFHKGLLTGVPQPVKLLMSLGADTERSPLHKYRQTRIAVLKQMFGDSLTAELFHSSGQLTVRNHLSMENAPMVADCHVVSVDEIWLDDLKKAGRLRTFSQHDLKVISGISHSDGKRGTQYITATGAIIRNTPERDDKRLFAIPERQNMGILAYWPELWEALIGSAQAKSPEKEFWKKAADDLKFAQRFSKRIAPSWEAIANMQSDFVKVRYQGPKFRGKQVYRLLEEDLKKTVLKLLPNDRSNTNDRKGIWKLPVVLKNDIYGFFTCTFETPESLAAFFLELLCGQSKKSPKTCAHFVGMNRKLKNNAEAERQWLEALVLWLRLMEPIDIHRVADTWFRPCIFERPCVLSRQWFSTWGTQHELMPGLTYLELPDKISCSGAWYLAIVKGSTARQAGLRLIRNLTSHAEELQRFHTSVGLPVSRVFYDGKIPPIELRQTVPYWKELKTMAELVDKFDAPTTGASQSKAARNALRLGVTPFHRASIAAFPQVSPVIIGLLSRVADEARNEGKWIYDRDEFPPKLTRTIAKCLKQALGEMIAMQER